MFSISALPLEGASQILTHFYHLWPLGQKSIMQIFFIDGLVEKWSSKMCQEGLIFSDFSTMYMYYP